MNFWQIRHLSYISTKFSMYHTKMLLFNFLSFVFLHFVSALDRSTINLSLEYFKYRDVKIICLLTCESDNWSQIFARTALKEQIITARVKADETLKDINTVARCSSQKFTSVGVLIDFYCPRFLDIVQFASHNQIFDAMHKWVVVDDDPQAANATALDLNERNKNRFNNTSVEVLGNLLISVNCDVTIVLGNGKWRYELYEAYNFGKEQGGSLIVEKIGSYDEEMGMVLNTDVNGYKYYRRWNFQNWKLRTVVVVTNAPEDFDPEVISGRTWSAHVPYITQVTFTCFRIIAEIHNISYKITYADRWIGDFTQNNSKVVTDALYFKLQDFSTLMRFWPEVHEKVDIVPPSLVSVEIRYYYRIPTHGVGKFENQFLRPLTTGAWICTLAVISLCAVILLLAAKFEHRPMAGQYAVFSAIASICQQAFEDQDYEETGRMSVARGTTTLVTGLFCVLIYNYYTSSVVSWLLNAPPPSIHSLQELLESPLDLIYDDSGYSRSWLKTPGYYFNRRNAEIENKIRQKKVFSKKKGDPLIIPSDEGIEMVKAGGYAYHTEINTANMLISQKFTQTELCEVGSLVSMEKCPLYAAAQKNSPYKEFFVWSQTRLLERGAVSCVKRRITPIAVSCEGSIPRALSLGEAAPAFVLLAAGYLLATVIVLFERLFHRYFGTKIDTS